MTSISLPSLLAFIISWFEISLSTTFIPLSVLIYDSNSNIEFLIVLGRIHPLSMGVASSIWPYLLYKTKNTFKIVIS